MYVRFALDKPVQTSIFKEKVGRGQESGSDKPKCKACGAAMKRNGSTSSGRQNGTTSYVPVVLRVKAKPLRGCFANLDPDASAARLSA